MLIYGSLVIGLFLVAGVIYGYNAVRSYLRSDEFRVMLGSRTGEVLKGKGDFTPFVWDGWSVATDEFNFVGADGVQKFEVRGIEGEVDIGAVWSQTYRLENIQLREFRFQGDFREGVTGSGEIDEWESEPGFFSDLLPDKVEVTGVDVVSLSGSALTDKGDWEWANASARISPGSGNQVYEVQLSGGKLATPLPIVDELRLTSAKGRYSGQQFFLLDSEFGILKDGILRATGDFDLDSQAWQIRGGGTGIKVQEIVDEDWKQRLMGPIVVNFEVGGRPDEEVVLRGDLAIKDGVLTALPVLDRIAAYANSVRFRRLALSRASLEFEQIGSSLDLKKIILASEGLVRIEGEMRIDGNVIEKGDFQVGITPGTLSHLPGAETKVFRRGRLGLLWAPMTVGGTLDAPQEDLSGRLIEAAKERMFEMIPERGQYALKFTGKAIGESTKAILKEDGIVLGAGKTILRSVEEILGGGGSQEEEEGEEKPAETPGEESGVIEKGKEVVGDGVGKLFDIFGRPISK